MNEYELIEQRYGFAIPPTYRLLEAQGQLDYRRQQEDWLNFYDCEWLSLEGIATYQFNSWEIAVDGGFVPFAITGGHEPYCWRLGLGHRWKRTADRDLRTIREGHLPGSKLQRVSCIAWQSRHLPAETTLSRPQSARTSLSRAVDILAEVLPPIWSARLLDLRAKPWKHEEKSGSMAVLSWAEGEQIIQADLSFPHLNEKFFHDKDYLKRLQNRK